LPIDFALFYKIDFLFKHIDSTMSLIFTLAIEDVVRTSCFSWC
jgi:hypothetical protein